MSCNIDFVNNWELRYQGAESRLYFGLHSNNRCVIKHRFSKQYRHPILDKKLTKERTKRERRMIEKIHAKSKELAPYMPKVIWSNESAILMTEIVDCESLYGYIEQNRSHINDLALLVGRCVAELHNAGIIHGDLTTSNLMLVPTLRQAGDTPLKKARTEALAETYIVLPIDFGLSTGSVHAEERAVDLYVLERALLATHFPDSSFFNSVFQVYLDNIDESTCEPPSSDGKQKIIERLKDVRARGRKLDYSNDQEV